MTAELPTGRPLRERRRKANERSTRFVAPALLVHAGPEIVEIRTRMGLRTPDGKLGIFSVAATYLLGIVGLIGLVSVLLALALDSDLWSDRDTLTR